MADVVQRTDVRMAQGGGRAGLDLEPLTRVWVCGDVRCEHSNGDRAVKSVSRAL